MRIIDRIQQLLNNIDIPVSQFERSCGFSNGYVLKMRKAEGSGMGEAAIIASLNFFRNQGYDISAEWLLTGEGNAYRPKMDMPLDELDDILTKLENKSSVPNETKQLLDTLSTRLETMQGYLVNLTEKIDSLKEIAS